ncbi:DUF6978 family protein [Schleiferilactobacillus shenzhenensis]|uniref:DUF6978 family protein n=1 Tax=Schleiferilactobacillus shenzhenensis TaxID=1231337 RepID=UPI00058DF8FE|nr:hypothetical protein [Schleiferilactobacillus shenzhenensis]
MNYDHLSNLEVRELIITFKQLLTKFCLNIPITGRYRDEEVVSDSVHGIEYVLHVYRGRVSHKYSIHLRFSKNNVHLIRLCINGSNHYNLDGSSVGSNHVHLYRFVNEAHMIELHAYPLTDFPFSGDQSLGQAVEAFIHYVNLHY